MHSPLLTLTLLLLTTTTSLVTSTWIPWKTSPTDCEDDEPTPLPPYPVETDCETTTTTPKWHPYPPTKTPWTTKEIPQPVSSSWTYSFTISVPHGKPTTTPAPPVSTYAPPIPPYPTASPSLSLPIGTPLPPKPTPSPSSSTSIYPPVPATSSSLVEVYPNSTVGGLPSPTKIKPTVSLGNATATGSPTPQQVSGAAGRMGFEVLVAALVGLGVFMASL
ncbi:hypothetical protein BKA64DRAFT_759062 [Cadophora sp. MPI-SDFR-AT-0126]|nr:hypothetical protein BKA64DRAFT_759062 [Leotiomycetes sp. MPI-SDFR-AT-0126]